MSQLRKLTIPTLHGEIQTPAFLPDATYGSIHNLSWEDTLATGTDALVSTTLHLELKLGADYVQEYGGLHKFFGWDRPILTDSGGFQVFSLIHRRPQTRNVIIEEGARFKDPVTGREILLTPELSQQIQTKLGSDIRVLLDEPLANGAAAEKNMESVRRTSAWAIRGRTEFLKLTGLESETLNGLNILDTAGFTPRPLLTAVVQGAHDYDLRRQSASELVELGFDGYNFGGLPLLPDGRLDLELSQMLVDLLPADKIRYAMGIGNPDDIMALAHMGWDLFDCVLPTRNARHGYIYVPKGEGDVDYEHYSVLHLKAERYKFADEPISSDSPPALRNISRAYLRHLLRIGEPAGQRLATMQNLWFYQKLLANLRQTA